jgi:Protein of unknown function (DUF1275)
MSVMEFSLMSTNVAGHFPRAFRELWTHHWEAGLSILTHVFCYFLGALITGFLCFKYSKNQRLMLLPYSMTLLILIGVSLLPLNSFLKLNLLFFTMANQNVFSSFITEGVVKPSQLTGILIDLAQNIAKFNLKIGDSLPIIKAQLVLLVSFIGGLFMAFITAESGFISSTQAAIVVQLVIVWLYFWKGRK